MDREYREGDIFVHKMVSALFARFIKYRGDGTVRYKILIKNSDYTEASLETFENVYRRIGHESDLEELFL